MRLPTAFKPLLICLLAVLILGCQPTRRTQTTGQPAPGGAASPVAPISNVDACATRLHDAAGSLLLYFFYYRYLPDTLEDLADIPGGPDIPPLICPVSNLPYIYNPDGIMLTEQRSLVVLYDAAPSHSNMRWAVTVGEPEVEGGPLVMKVVALPESFFLLR